MKALLADDHPLFLDGLENLLTARGVQVVGTARAAICSRHWTPRNSLRG
jgi:DNA-binding NarL/FixJ family response regulator